MGPVVAFGRLREWIIPGGCAVKDGPPVTLPTGRKFLKSGKVGGQLFCPVEAGDLLAVAGKEIAIG